MTMLSGLQNRDVAVALTALREMYGLEVTLNVFPPGRETTILCLRVEWSDAGNWDNRWWSAAVMRHPDFTDFFLRPGEAVSPSVLFRCIMIAETSIEEFYKAALAAGMPPVDDKS